ncbi:MAG: hypothetical protein V1659_01330 [Candidatus Woesearchaeota archaeon]
MAKKTSRFLFWTPRILAIVFLLFLALFSLDVFEGNYGFWGTLLALFMHNIPVFVLAIVLWASWKREWIGGVVFILAGLLYLSIILVAILTNEPRKWYMLFWILQISGPAFLTGILFLIGWFRKKK